MSLVYTIGETTYDIVFVNDEPIRGIVGGSVLNTSVSLGRCGIPVHFLSSLGSDHIAEIALNFLLENSVNCNSIVRFKGNSRISLAFLDANNNAEYQFYDTEIKPSLVYPEVQRFDYVVFGSSNAIKDDGREALLHFLDRAKKSEALIVYDPNIRSSSQEVKRKVDENFSRCHIIKASTEDFVKLYNMNNADEIFQMLSCFGVKVLILTDGEKPVLLKTDLISKYYQPTVVEAISTIGAGDNFTAGLIAGLFEKNVHLENIAKLPESVWDELISYGNSFASDVCLSELNYISKEFGRKFSIRL